MVRRYNIPKSVVREAYRSDEWKAELSNCVAKIRDLADELGLINGVSKWIWQVHGIWDEPGARRTAGTNAA
jgi:hypothetical protein